MILDASDIHSRLKHNVGVEITTKIHTILLLMTVFDGAFIPLGARKATLGEIRPVFDDIIQDTRSKKLEKRFK